MTLLSYAIDANTRTNPVVGTVIDARHFVIVDKREWSGRTTAVLLLQDWCAENEITVVESLEHEGAFAMAFETSADTAGPDMMRAASALGSYQRALR